ncbi:7-carboxy-7-deazaguanine synthase [Porphyromonas sp. CAG:1061]|nr:7-carboxy-7-deazaguanine synthase [Porphyromonas sp. CAG:1061]
MSLDYITLSPKVKWDKVTENYRDRAVGELRFPIAEGNPLPEIERLPKAMHYYLSPIFDGDRVVAENIGYCQQLIEEDPRWSLSLQMHKLIGIR